MNLLASQSKLLLRSLLQANVRQDVPEAVIKSFKLSLIAVVSGFDNKHTYYKTKIREKWAYGDDACFLSKTDSACVLGVADGVGGWRSYGIDPSHFSRAVMATCERLVSSGHFKSNKPIHLIKEGYEEVLNLKKPIMGSATLCVLSLCCHGRRLYAANLGDSGYLVVRKGQILQRSLLQKHDFNTPFQLANLPPGHPTELFRRDTPDQAFQSYVDVEPGDLVIVGTDGLFNNLPEAMILREINSLRLSDPVTSLSSQLVRSGQSWWTSQTNDALSHSSHTASLSCDDQHSSPNYSNAADQPSTSLATMATSTWSDILQPVLRAVRRPDIRVQIDSSNYHQTATLPCDPCDSYPVQIAGFPVDVADLSTSDSLPAPFSLHNLQDELQFCADRLVELARRASESRVFVSPFANEARRYGLNIVGGLPGDITVILARVTETSQIANANEEASKEFSYSSLQTSASLARVLKEDSRHSSASKHIP